MCDANTFSVTLHVYDLSQGIARQMSQSILGKQIDGIWHTGVVVYNKEYFFGGGIQALPPHQVVSTYGMQPHQVLPLGETSVPQSRFEEYLNEISPRFTSQTYDLLRNNCNNFSHVISTFLIGHGIPQHIIDLPNEALSSPIGSMLRPMIESMQQSMSNSTGGQQSFGIPFNSSSHSSNFSSTYTLGKNILLTQDPEVKFSSIKDGLLSLRTEDASLSTDELQMLEQLTVALQEQSTKQNSIMGTESELFWRLAKNLVKQNLLKKAGFYGLCLARIGFLMTGTKDMAEVVSFLELLLEWVNSENMSTLLNSCSSTNDVSKMSFTIVLLSAICNSFGSTNAKPVLLLKFDDIIPLCLKKSSFSEEVKTLACAVLWNYAFTSEGTNELIEAFILGGVLEILDDDREGSQRNVAILRQLLEIVLLLLQKSTSAINFAKDLRILTAVSKAVEQSANSNSQLQQLYTDISRLC